MESICDAQSREDRDVVTVFRQAKRKSKMERGKKKTTLLPDLLCKGQEILSLI